MYLLNGIITLPIAFAILISIVSKKWKGFITLTGILASSLLTGYYSIMVFNKGTITQSGFAGSVIGQIDVVMDPLSAWFVLLMNFTMITSTLFATGYLRRYTFSAASFNLHWISLLINQMALTLVFLVQNSLLFMIVWEIMAFSAFLLIIFEYQKPSTLRAGINFMIQSHISILFLLLAFFWVITAEGSYSFKAIASYYSHSETGSAVVLFILFFAGFGIKAGFIPFHTWLPYAHPAAPSHISGMMSGVMIKAGIYGILRILLLSHSHWLTFGVIVLTVGILSGLYGVMMAILQHNLKRLLAYHSIENIGIIGIGIGLGSIGIGMGHNLLALAGFSGAILHVLNHSLFKSLLFYGSGVIYQSAHTLQIDNLGGLIKKIPVTASLFLLASLAICGLPPFNGFISEFLLYFGLFNSLYGNSFTITALLILAATALVLIGGLAIFCFAKAFGIVFLGQPRSAITAEPQPPTHGQMGAMIATAIFIGLIGLFPGLFFEMLLSVTVLFTGLGSTEGILGVPAVLQHISTAALIFIFLTILIWFVRNNTQKKRVISENSTWGCGAQISDYRQQYTATSFVRTYRKIAEPLFIVQRHRPTHTNLLPTSGHFSTHITDAIEAKLIDAPIRRIKAFIGRFNFLQNGSVRFYVLYGIIFIFAIILIPFIIDAIYFINELIK